MQLGENWISNDLLIGPETEWKFEVFALILSYGHIYIYTFPNPNMSKYAIILVWPTIWCLILSILTFLITLQFVSTRTVTQVRLELLKVIQLLIWLVYFFCRENSPIKAVVSFPYLASKCTSPTFYFHYCIVSSRH